MIVVCDRYTENTEGLRDTLRRLGADARIVVLEDHGFLPEGILSPYEYFISGQRREEQERKELYYAFLNVPPFWEIRWEGAHGAVYDMNCKKADIFFAEPTEKRTVQRVEWHMENGRVYRIDYYNRYARKYASAFLDAEGKVESRVFYSAQNQEVIVQQPQQDTVALLENGKTRAFFTSHTEFIEYFLDEIGSGEKRMRISDRELLYTIPDVYPVNAARGEALILTASDQLEGIACLIEKLREVMFHIAASTQVSDRLSKLGELENVKVYPQISSQELDHLWEKCDFYLDINYYWEIHNAIDTAHRKNLLILGFERTLHHRELVAEECIFSETEKMAQAVRELVNHPAQTGERLAAQQRKKREIWEKLLAFEEVSI